jgi:cytochrome c2
MKTILFTVALIIQFVSCNKSNNRNFYGENNNSAVKDSIHPGKKLMETYCYACHNAINNEKNRLAPPMIAVKRHYLFENSSKEDFIKNIQKWITNPTEENAKMFGAVRRFGVMPKQPFSEEIIMQIADYMYDNDIDQPEWFEEHHKKKRQNRF